MELIIRLLFEVMATLCETGLREGKRDANCAIDCMGGMVDLCDDGKRFSRLRLLQNWKQKD